MNHIVLRYATTELPETGVSTLLAHCCKELSQCSAPADSRLQELNREFSHATSGIISTSLPNFLNQLSVMSDKCQSWGEGQRVGTRLAPVRLAQLKKYLKNSEKRSFSFPCFPKKCTSNTVLTPQLSRSVSYKTKKLQLLCTA